MTTWEELTLQVEATHVKKAAQWLDENNNEFAGYGNSRRYDAIIGNKKYPPKMLFSKAYHIATGELLDVYFGAEKGYANKRLEQLGVIIKKKNDTHDQDSKSIKNIDFNREDKIRLGHIKERRGQADFRKLLIKIFHKCVVTDTEIEDLLEAAHIIPHAEGANYHESNGLLLRADIHTLYDLNLLSIDKSFKIHLHPKIKGNIEYNCYHGKSINIKDGKDLLRMAENLAQRHKRFLEKI